MSPFAHVYFVINAAVPGVTCTVGVDSTGGGRSAVCVMLTVDAAVVCAAFVTASVAETTVS